MSLDIITPAWLEDAICSQVDPALFFPEKGGDPRPAKRICGSCDASAACLSWAVSNAIPYGIYGGMTERDRRHLKRCRRCEELAVKGSPFCGPVCRAESRAESLSAYERRRAVA